MWSVSIGTEAMYVTGFIGLMHYAFDGSKCVALVSGARGGGGGVVRALGSRV